MRVRQGILEGRPLDSKYIIPDMKDAPGFRKHTMDYAERLSSCMESDAMHSIPVLAGLMLDVWQNKRNIYLCGNGDSAANAVHIANDLIYGTSAKNGVGIKAEALTANSVVLTCLANDLGYEDIFSEQLKVKAGAGDLLIVLSGSGNSVNVVRAIEVGDAIGMQTCAILGYSGGRCKEIVQHPIHFEVNDMQISEDLQLIVGHICVQWLCEQDLLLRGP